MPRLRVSPDSGRPANTGRCLAPDPDSPDEGERDRDPDEAPETPLDEPRPPRVEEPPPQADPKGPYVV
jgi:hypothetical protein